MANSHKSGNYFVLLMAEIANRGTNPDAISSHEESIINTPSSAAYTHILCIIYTYTVRVLKVRT